MKQRARTVKGRPVRFEVASPKTKAKHYECPIELSLDYIGGKWKSVILWHLHVQKTPMRFNELRKKMPDLHERMLARTLRELERSGIVFRDIYPEVPPHVEYGLTARGKTLSPVLISLCKWGKENGWERPKSS